MPRGKRGRYTSEPFDAREIEMLPGVTVARFFSECIVPRIKGEPYDEQILEEFMKGDRCHTNYI